MSYYRSGYVVRLVVILLILTLALPLTLVRCPGTPVDRVPPVVIWHGFGDGSHEDRALRQVLSAITAGVSGYELEIWALGDALGAAVGQSLTHGGLPDLLLAPAEWAVYLDRRGALHRLTAEASDSWLPPVAASLLWDGNLLGLPLMTEVVGLGRASALAQLAWPASPAELAAQAEVAAKQGLGALFWPIDSAYYTLPWFLAGGGELEPASPGESDGWLLRPEANELATLGWLEVVELLAVTASGWPPDDLVEAWRDGRVSFAPLLPFEYLALRSAGLAVQLGPLPGARALVSTWALMLPRRGPSPSQSAIDLLARLRAHGDDGLLHLSQSLGYLPPSLELFQNESVVASGLAALGKAAANAAPMPYRAYAAEVWSVYEAGLGEFLAGAKAEDVYARLKSRIEQLPPQVP